jgi:DNA polymerase III subunit delta'
MAWETVIGQERIKQMLQTAVEGGRCPQALLLTGDDGYGTLAIAIGFARLVNSLDVRSTKQADSLQHPNISFVVALPTGKAGVEAELSEEVLDELKELKATLTTDPYIDFRLTGASQIRISQIRELKRQLSMSSTQEGRRVVIIHHAEDMTTEAANAFLKTLEEPHDDVTVILTSPSTQRLLPTIVSRCQEITVPPLTDEEVAASLIRDEACSEDEARLIASFSEGSVIRARSYLSEDVKADRQSAVELLRSALKGRGYRLDLTSAVSVVAEGRDKHRASMILSMLALWLRDARALIAAGPDAAIVNMDQREPLQRFAENFATVDFDTALDVIEAAVRDIQRNVTIAVVVLTAMIEIRSVFARTRSRGSEAA